MLCDWEIKELVDKHGMIDPFIDHQINRDSAGNKVISYGLTSFGYDIRLSTKFKVFNNRAGGIIDPLDFQDNLLLDEAGDYCIIPPNCYLLGSTIESFKMPNNVVADCVGKSTLARCGLILNVTPLEPGWEAQSLTLEISNATPLPAKVYANMGIGQLRFYRGSNPLNTYKNRATGPGKYQMQGTEPVTARIN